MGLLTPSPSLGKLSPILNFKIKVPQNEYITSNLRESMMQKFLGVACHSQLPENAESKRQNFLE